MKAKRLTPSPFDLPASPEGSPNRPSVVALIRQYLACDGGRSLEELRRKLDPTITEDERQEAMRARKYKTRVVNRDRSLRESGATRGKNWL